MAPATVGFRVKTGWAAAVLVADARTSPRILDVSRVELYDPAVKNSGAPFHVGLELPESEARKVIPQLVAVVERVARRSMEDLLVRYDRLVGRIDAAGVVVGSQIDPATIRNDHIRAHAEESRLYRSVVLAATETHGLKTSVFLEKQLYDRAAATRGVSVPDQKKELAALGRHVEGEWRAVQKEAVLAAILMAY